MYKKLILFLGVIMTIGIGVCGCGMNEKNNKDTSSSTKNNTIELNERQKEILKEACK